MSNPSWMKTGQSAKQEHMKQNQTRTNRFYLPVGKETQITFVDGSLNDAGLPDVPSFWEHNLKMDGHWRNWFPCVREQEPCPICALGDHNPYLATVLTVIDHSEYEDREGVLRKHNKRLFVAKPQTYRRLARIAHKRGGLNGKTFDVARTGDQSAAVGSDFDYLGECDTEQFIAQNQQFGVTSDLFTPYDYGKVIVYRNAAELKALGIGQPTASAAPPPVPTTGGFPAGKPAAMPTTVGGEGAEDFDDDIPF